jgi:hypothetical protein
MASRVSVTAPLAAAVLALGTQASARAPQPLIPTALVEDVNSTTAEVEFMDYVGRGQVIKLGSSDILVLSYLKSCEHETITGGSVVVGAERSEVQGGKIVRTKVPCDGGKMKLTSQQAATSGASAFRLQSVNIRPTLYAQVPVVQLPKVLPSSDRMLVIERIDPPGGHQGTNKASGKDSKQASRQEIKIADDLAGGDFYDLAKANVRLASGGVYKATLGDHEMMFRIDAKAKAGKTPVVSRLLRFQ